MKAYKGVDLRLQTGTHPEFIIILGGGGGANPDAVCNLCLLLNIMLWESRLKYSYTCNITLLATAFLYI
jgi:hypothetical protein